MVFEENGQYHHTISQYSTDTARGGQALTAFCVLLASSLSWLAVIRQTTTATDRHYFLFAIELVGYACIAATGMIPSGNVTPDNRRAHNPCCCATWETGHCGSDCCCACCDCCALCPKSGGLLHVGFFVLYIVLPSASNFIGWGFGQLPDYVGGLTIVTDVFFLIHGILSCLPVTKKHGCARWFSFLTEIFTVMFSMAAFGLAQLADFLPCIARNQY
jgi:hypothetical protein